MGVDSRRPPLPAPTESMDETDGVETELATNLTTRTDKTTYSIPEDGTPITIATQKHSGGHHSRQKSQTSLLIEYFESSKSGDKTRSRPSVRVKVTPSSAKRSKHGAHDAIQITGIGKDRKPSYTRRISLGNSKNVEPTNIEGTELSHSSESNVSGRPPVEIEVLEDHNASDLSNARSTRGLRYAQVESNISSLPPESMVGGSALADSELLRNIGRGQYEDDAQKDHLSAPVRTRSRSRSQERITQKVMEKLSRSTGKARKPSRSEQERSITEEYDAEGYPIKPRRRRVSKHDEEFVSAADSSLLSSNPAASQRSYRSNTSQGSRMTNNPKLLEMVEDTIKRMILPEINAIKEDQKTDRNLRTFKENQQGSVSRDSYDDESLERRLSKSSSTPNISTKPKVVLNRDGDDPGTVLSRGDSERREQRYMRKSSREEHVERPSSRRSSGRNLYQGDGYDEEEHFAHRSDKTTHKLRDAAVAGLAGGALTAAAMKTHDSHDDDHIRRKKRTKSRGSRSRSASYSETAEESFKTREHIPPMPLASHVNDSDMTRQSLVSEVTEMPETREVVGARTPVREVSRGSLGALSPVSARTPTRSPALKSLDTSHGGHSYSGPASPSTGARMAALAAAGLGGFAAAKGFDSSRSRHVDIDGYGSPTSPRNVATGSPAQSVSSIKKHFEEDDSLIPSGLRPKSAASRSSAGKLHNQQISQSSLRSTGSSPTTNLARQLSPGDDLSKSLDLPDAAFMHQSTGTPGTPGTPNNEAIDEWYERQHRINDRYRDSFGERATNRDSYQTNPFPDDDRRIASFGDNVEEYPEVETVGDDKEIQPIGVKPKYVYDSFGAESNVASLMDPSMLSNSMASGQGSPERGINGTYANRMADHIRDMEKRSPAIYEGSTLSQTGSSQDRWAALKGHARNLSASTGNDDALSSPRHSPIKSLRDQNSVEPVMGASGLPLVHDPLPEIGHFNDSKSDLTEPSVVHGPLGGDATGKSTWPYTPEPMKVDTPDSKSSGVEFSKEKGLVAAAAGGAAARAAARAANETDLRDERKETSFERGANANRDTTLTSPGAFRDEGYVTDNHGRSVEVITPHPDERRYSPEDIAEYECAMDAQDLGDDDPFTGPSKHNRHLSGNSHGMASPLYDSSTGKGIDRIQSQDIVALMDHLTVRDAQRNARDTEILVTLVRSAAEMRTSFDEMRRFIAEQDRLIMQNTDRDAEQTVQKVLGGPRAQPTAPSRTPRGASDEEVQAKRKNVLRRALKGLTGGKKADDLARVEDMLMQILDNVEDLKHYGPNGQQTRSYSDATLDSYEKLRAGAESGYEPEEEGDTSSTPNHSGQLPTTPRGDKHQYHSGYDGRRGSINRVSTVAEGDEDDDELLEPHERLVLNNQFENNERMLTPTQENHRSLGLSPQQDLTPKAAEKQRKHKSNSSSIFGVPKISRWSKTTSSSAAPDMAALESPDFARAARPLSGASHSGSQVGKYEDDGYKLHDNDRLRSPQSVPRGQQRPISQADSHSMHSQGSRLTRTPSPLIPSEASIKHRDDYDRYDDEPEPSPIHQDDALDFDDPKYQAHRNSLLLQHPQPVQGTTGRHQNTLETQAQGYDPKSPTSSDVSQRTVSDFDPAMWGSSGTAALARNRFSDPSSTGSYAGGRRRSKDDDPLVPHKSADQHSVPYDDDEDDLSPDDQDWGLEYSNSGFSKGGHYSSPYGSGHLLEPIEERYSLEVDGLSERAHSISPEPHFAKAVDVRNVQRKITGPRPMGSRSPAPAAQRQQAKLVDSASGTVRRKVVGSGRGSQDSLRSESF